MGEIALALFYQLQAPGQHDEDGRRIDPEEVGRRALVRIKQIFGLSTAHEPQAGVAPASSRPEGSQQDAGATEAKEEGPNLTEQEWEAREPVRQLLENILTRQVEICEAQRKAILKESLAGPSPYERAAEIAPTHRNAPLMRRMQDSNFREVRRVTNMLLKIKRHERQMEALEQDDEGDGSAESLAMLMKGK